MISAATMRKIMQPTDAALRKAADIILQGGVIIAPSDTNLALALDPWNKAAVQRAFAIKRRPVDAPLTLFPREPEDWEAYTNVPTVDRPTVQALVRAFWPGPFNIVLPRNNRVPSFLVCGGDTVAISVITNPTIHRLLGFTGRPIAMTSANLHGQASGMLVDVATATEQVGDAVDMILEGGRQGATTCSTTIVELNRGTLSILRQGDVSADAISQSVAGQRVHLAF